MNLHTVFAAGLVGLTLTATAAQAQSFTQGFDEIGVMPAGWVTNNLSTSASNIVWRIYGGLTDGTHLINPYEGNAFAQVSYQSISAGSGTISNWLISPTITGMQNGDSFSFYTTTFAASAYPDALEFRLSTAGTGTDVGATPTSVGSFSTTLLSINSALDVGGYPESWTRYTVTLSGLSAPATGRVAFRYVITDGGPLGGNSNAIAMDQFSYVAAAVPEPGTWAMSLAGIAALAGAMRARCKTAARH